MGLDNGFIIRNKQDEKFSLEIGYFRKFYELDEFIRTNCNEVSPDIFSVTVEVLEALKEELLPTVQVLIKIPQRLLEKYDFNGIYPKKYGFDNEEAIYDTFNPHCSGSAFPGWKALKLYNVVCTMINFLNDDYEENHYIEFYSSY